MSEHLPLRVNPLPLPRALRRNKPRLGKSGVKEGPRPVRAPGTLSAGATMEGALINKPRIVSTAHGAIAEMLLCYPAYAEDEYSYRAVYADLLRQMPAGTKFVILTHPEVADELQAMLTETGTAARTRVVMAPPYLEFLVWAEDGYAAIHDTATEPSTVYLVEPFAFDRYGDTIVADLVARSTEVQHIQSPLYFQGGNLLIGDDFVLIGADYPAESRRLIREHEHLRVPDGIKLDDWIRELYQETFDPSRRVIYVGTKDPAPAEARRQFKRDGQTWSEEIHAGVGERQPIFHIDMFISLAGRGADGRYRLVVGSPGLAAKLLGEKLPDHALDPLFDQVAAQLSELGFDVRRSPLPLTYVDDPEARLRSWYFATANNCLVQIDETAGHHVWLPTYGHGDWAQLSKVDDEHERIWRELGFTVQRLLDFHPFAQNLGAVHCIKKYLRRT